MIDKLPGAAAAPTVRINKATKIYLHQEMLRCIGKPDYLRFLWHDGECMLVIAPCARFDDGAYSMIAAYKRDDSTRLKNKRMFTELYARTVRAGLSNLDTNADYRFCGVYFAELNMVGFRFAEAVRIERSAK